MSSVWEAQLQYDAIVNNAPKSGNFYNQSFVDRINAARQNIDNLVADKDKAYSSINQAKDEYDSFTGSMRSYSDVYKESSDEFDVRQRQDDYEKSKSALAMTESVLEALPSSISARSGRVLTQEQRNLAYNRQADLINQTRTSQSAAVNTYEQAWKNARENQAARTEKIISEQRANQQTLQSVWTGTINNYNQLQSNIAKSRLELLQEQNAYRSWQDQQWQNQYNIWKTQLAAATQRIIQARENEYNDKQIAINTAKLQKQLEYDQWKKSLYSNTIERADRFSGGGGGGGGGGGW